MMPQRLIAILYLVFLLAIPFPAAAQTTASVTTQDALIQAMIQLIAILQEQVRLLQAQLTLKTQTPQGTVIDANAIVYLTCQYEPKNTPGLNITTVCGTGVIVNPKGYILTARHIIDPAWTVQSYPADANISFYKDLAQGYVLKECMVAYPSVNRLPTPTEIRTLNPAVFVGEDKYVATTHFVPQTQNVSTDEYQRLDFGILRIDRAVSCTAPGCAMPTTFPYTPVSASVLSGTPELVSYGYPRELGVSLRGGLKGAAGNLVKYYAGDDRFAQKPLLFEWSATDSRKGRSGSPVFANGKMIGISIGAAEENVTVNYGLALPAIQEILIENGLGNMIAP